MGSISGVLTLSSTVKGEGQSTRNELFKHAFALCYCPVSSAIRAPAVLSTSGVATRVAELIKVDHDEAVDSKDVTQAIDVEALLRRSLCLKIPRGEFCTCKPSFKLKVKINRRTKKTASSSPTSDLTVSVQSLTDVPEDPSSTGVVTYVSSRSK